MTTAAARAPSATRTAQLAEFAVIGLGRMARNLVRHARAFRATVQRGQ